MNIILFCIRVVIGGSFCVISLGFFFIDGSPNPAMASLLVGLITLWPLSPMIFGQHKPLPVFSIKWGINIKGILTFFRWSLGLIFSMAAIGGFMNKENLLAIAILLMGLIFISPLDAIIFEWEDALLPLKHKNRKERILAVVLRNTGLLYFVASIGYYLEGDKITATILLVIGLSMLFGMPVTIFLKHRNASLLFSSITAPYRPRAQKESIQTASAPCLPEAPAVHNENFHPISNDESPTIIDRSKNVYGILQILQGLQSAVRIKEDHFNSLIKYEQIERESENLITEEPSKKIAVVAESRGLEKLKQAYLELSKLEPHKRGYAFQDFLNKLFSLYNLAPKTAFRLTGEEIDGSFELDSHIYLLEAKWQTKQSGQSDLLVFNGKVEGKSTWARGIFISHTGFTKDGLEAFARGKRTSIIGMDGQDILLILDGKHSLIEAIKKKVRRAVERINSPTVKIASLSTF